MNQANLYEAGRLHWFQCPACRHERGVKNRDPQAGLPFRMSEGQLYEMKNFVECPRCGGQCIELTGPRCSVCGGVATYAARGGTLYCEPHALPLQDEMDNKTALELGMTADTWNIEKISEEQERQGVLDDKPWLLEKPDLGEFTEDETLILLEIAHDVLNSPALYRHFAERLDLADAVLQPLKLKVNNALGPKEPSH